MDSKYYSDSKRNHTVNPADLHTRSFSSHFIDEFCALADANIRDQWSPPVKMEPLEPSMDSFFDLGESSQPSNTPSPSADMIFSQANSPGDFLRDRSRTTSRETSTDNASQHAPTMIPTETWRSMFPMPDAMYIPQTVKTPIEEPPTEEVLRRETATVYLSPDKTKTRAETQIKVNLILDPLEKRFEHIRFPRRSLAKPKLLASPEEQDEMEGKKDVVYMDLLLVCATAIDDPERRQQALRRARGDEPIPRRSPEQTIAELDKSDPAHPQNGGEVLICDGCRERERKRYDRKKKKAEDEAEWFKYEADRVVMINEKEYRKWKDVEPAEQNHKYSPDAKQVEFAMRIACYCRHQEEKSPVGYRVIFTFKDSKDKTVIAQHISEIFQITDDHKNKEVAPECLPHPLNIPQQPYLQNQFPNSMVMPQYQYADGQYPQAAAMGPYSQPPTPVMSNFQTPMSPMDAQFSQSNTPNGLSHAGTPNGLPRQQGPSFSTASTSITAPQFPRPQPQTRYDVPMMSPTGQFPSEPSFLSRPVSMENFSFGYNGPYQFNTTGFATAPPSAVSTPINLSRPASPTWEQGPTKKKMFFVGYYVDDE